MTMAPWTKTVYINSLTLPTAVRFIHHELNAGIAEALFTTSSFYDALPFQRVEGDAGETYYDDCENIVSEISSSAKKLGRAYIRDVAKTLSTHSPVSAENERISFKMLRVLMAQVKSPDFFMAHHNLIRSIYALYRVVGTAWDDRWEFPSGRVVPVHDGVPVFRNDFMSEQEIVVGRFDRGTRNLGVSGLVPDAGFIGAARIRSGWHLTFTGGLTIFSDDAVASLVNVERY